MQFFDIDDIIVFYYARDPISHMKSMITWAVKRAQSTLGEAVYAQKGGYYFTFVERYERYFKHFIVRPFAPKKFYNGRLIDDFLYHCGCKVDLSEVKELYRNQGLGLYSTIIFSEVLKKYPFWVNGKVNVEHGLKKSSRGDEFITIYQRINDIKFDVRMDFNEYEKTQLHTYIDQLNKHLPKEDWFSHVDQYEDCPNLPQTLSDIPEEFIIDLINSYNQYIEDITESYEAQIKALEQQVGTKDTLEVND